MPESGFDVAAASDAFFDKLFKERPELRHRFEDLETHRRVFQDALRKVIDDWDDTAGLARYFAKVGDVHRMRGISRVHMLVGYRALVAAFYAGFPGMGQKDQGELAQIYARIAGWMGYTINPKDLT